MGNKDNLVNYSLVCFMSSPHLKVMDQIFQELIPSYMMTRWPASMDLLWANCTWLTQPHPTVRWLAVKVRGEQWVLQGLWHGVPQGSYRQTRETWTKRLRGKSPEPLGSKGDNYKHKSRCWQSLSNYYWSQHCLMSLLTIWMLGPSALSLQMIPNCGKHFIYWKLGLLVGKIQQADKNLMKFNKANAKCSIWVQISPDSSVGWGGESATKQLFKRTRGS